MGKITWEGWQKSADNAAEPKIGIALLLLSPCPICARVALPSASKQREHFANYRSDLSA